MSDAGLLAYGELDDALEVSAMAGSALADARTGRNGRHALVGLLRQSVFGRLAGYEDVNDAERLRHDPAMRCIVGGKAASGTAASPSQMGRFEPRLLIMDEPTNHLVPTAMAEILGQLRGRYPDSAILIVSHERDIAACVDQVLVLRDRMLRPLQPVLSS